MTSPLSLRLSGTWRMLLQSIFWIAFVAWPLLIRPEPPKPPASVHVPPDPKYMVALNLLSVLFFYLNTRVLIPKLLEKKGVGVYLAAVAGVVLLTIALSLGIRTQAAPADWTNVRFVMGTIFPVMFIYALSTTYKVLNDFHHRRQQEKERENERLKSELSFLRSQISPHFLFNILNSIVSLARFKPESVEPATIQLAELLRYMLYESDEDRVPIRQEVAYLKSYVDLQILRLGKKVHVGFDTGGADGNQYIEPMLLIPFVENAFKHGIGLIQQPMIVIHLSVQEDTLFFSVRNKVSSHVDEPKDHRSGIGLKNVQRRLNMLYPEHHLEVWEADGWFDVQLTLVLK